ncbi:MAG: DMT family transporter [Deltaproteobacteria bacterium]|nr:DMT family transporter [Deltaproteobacteria bacterium]
MAALLAGAVGIAFAPIFVRWSEVEPTVTAFWRVLLAAAPMWLWTRRQHGVRKPAGARDYLYLALPGVFFAGDLGVWHWSIKYTSVANSTLLANLAPVFVTLGGWLVFRRRFRRLFLIGMAVAIAGAVVLVGDSLHFGDRHALGDGLGLLTAVFYASYILAVGKLREEFSTTTILAWSATSAAVVLFPICAALGEAFLPATATGWAVLIGLAMVSHVGGQGLIAYALAHLPAAFSSVTLLVQPVMATFLAWIFFNESLGAWQAAGAVVIVIGILLARRGSVTVQASAA